MNKGDNYLAIFTVQSSMELDKIGKRKQEQITYWAFPSLLFSVESISSLSNIANLVYPASYIKCAGAGQAEWMNEPIPYWMEERKRPFAIESARLSFLSQIPRRLHAGSEARKKNSSLANFFYHSNPELAAPSL